MNTAINPHMLTAIRAGHYATEGANGTTLTLHTRDDTTVSLSVDGATIELSIAQALEVVGALQSRIQSAMRAERPGLPPVPDVAAIRAGRRLAYEAGLDW